MNYGTQVQSIIEKSDKSFDIIKGLPFNHRDTINRIYFYKNDRFVECSDPAAVFWNVVKPYIMHFAKNLDLDPKDFRAIGRGKANYYQSWILGIKFKQWADENNLSIKIDDLTQLVSEYGSFVWKLVTDEEGENDIEPCDLRNLYFDPSVKSVRETDIVEMHYLTESEILAKADVWDNVDGLIRVANSDKENTQNEFTRKEIWEFTGYNKDKKKWVHVIGAGYGDDAVIAFEETIEKEDNKYFDFHLDKFSGRWLRIGAYETNFLLQEQANTVVNENASANAIASLLLLRSQDPNTKGNVLRGAVSGQIITSADLQQIGIDNRAAGVLLNQLDRIEAQVRKNLMLPDIATGDALPSGTPFRGMAVMSNAYKSAFKQMRNRVAEPLKDIIQEQILPSLVNEWNKEELMELAGNEQDIQMYDEALKIKRKIMFLDELDKQNIVLSSEELDTSLKMLDRDTEEKINKVGRKIELGKKFFNFEYGFTIDPTGETYDKAQQNDALIQAITFESQNPALTKSPRYQQLLENNGLDQSPLPEEVKQDIMMANQETPLPQVPQQSLSSMVDTGNL